MATVRVPATSANLGPGFDCVGLGLDIWDEVTATPAGEWSVEVTGCGSDTVARDETHLVLRAYQAGLAAAGSEIVPVALACRNEIPHGRGLGSSAAAICAGLLLASAVADLPSARLLSLAAKIEGHPDNVAACLLGGLTVSWTGTDGAAAVAVPVTADVRPVLFLPAQESLTTHARTLLPPTVSHQDAAWSAGRAALLVVALMADPDALLAATDDRLHQPYRAAAMPESAALITTLRGAGVAAALSGAGPSVIALTRTAEECATAAALAPDGWSVRQPAIAGRGAHLVDGGS